MTMTIDSLDILQDPESWVDLYGDYLFKFAVSRIRDASAAEDLVQDTFLAALHARERFKGRSSVKTWLTGILKHKIVDHLRKKVRQEKIDHFGASDDEANPLFDTKGAWRNPPGEWSVNPMKAYEQKEFFGILERCLSELSARLAAAFTLREVDGFDTKEICKVLDISETNLWVMLYRARMRLRRCLESNWFDLQTL